MKKSIIVSTLLLSATFTFAFNVTFVSVVQFGSTTETATDREIAEFTRKIESGELDIGQALLEYKKSLVNSRAKGNTYEH